MSHVMQQQPDSFSFIFPRFISLLDDEMLKIERFGKVSCVRGPKLAYISAFSTVRKIKGVLLDQTQYVYVIDGLRGDKKMVKGPALVFPTQYEEITERRDALTLKQDEFVRLMNRETGQMRVVIGPASVFIDPYEEIVGNGKQKGIPIDKNTAVLVRNIETGDQQLITKPQVFFPTEVQEVQETRSRIKLEQHQVAVVKDKDGAYVYRRGHVEAERAFFLGPYESLLELRWSSGLTKTEKALRLSTFDIRPKFMWFDFEARTKDNVELKLGLTFFWNIDDVPKMVSVTDDASGDVCSHARSLVIQAVSQVSLELFLANFNQIVQNAVFFEGESFYSERGLTINQVEVRSVACADSKVQKVLQDIIQETTNKLNQLVKHEAQSEIKLKEIASDIQVETQRGKLLEVQKAHSQTEAEISGKGDAERIRAFLDGLGDDLSLPQKLELFQLLKRNEALALVSSGTAQVYFTPDQCNLTIETKK